MKKILIMMLALVLAFSLVSLVSCGDGSGTADGNGQDGGDTPAAPTYADYTVTLIDALGNPINNVIVEFKDADGNVKQIAGNGVIPIVRNLKIKFNENTIGEIR